MIHLDLAYPVTLHGKGLIDDQTVEIGDLAPVERMMTGGGYQGNGLLTDLINGEVLSNSLLRSLLSALGIRVCQWFVLDPISVQYMHSLYLLITCDSGLASKGSLLLLMQAKVTECSKLQPFWLPWRIEKFLATKFQWKSPVWWLVFIIHLLDLGFSGFKPQNVRSASKNIFGGHLSWLLSNHSFNIQHFFWRPLILIVCLVTILRF